MDGSGLLQILGICQVGEGSIGRTGQMPYSREDTLGDSNEGILDRISFFRAPLSIIGVVELSLSEKACIRYLSLAIMLRWNQAHENEAR